MTSHYDSTVRQFPDRARSVSPALTPRRRPRRHRENPDYTAFVGRTIDALGRRVAGGDIDGLADLAALSARLDDAIRTAITGLRDEGPHGQRGHSWADIGGALGVTRQSAQERWGGRRDR